MPINVAFDIDNTLWKVVPLEEKNGIITKFKQVPDVEMFQLLYWYLKNGNSIFIWSAGGLEYAQNWAEKYLPIDSNIFVIEKKVWYREHTKPTTYNELLIDICYDDQEVNLAKVNIKVNNREYTEE